jgi:hypothetical protein
MDAELWRETIGANDIFASPAGALLDAQNRCDAEVQQLGPAEVWDVAACREIAPVVHVETFWMDGANGEAVCFRIEVTDEVYLHGFRGDHRRPRFGANLFVGQQDIDDSSPNPKIRPPKQYRPTWRANDRHPIGLMTWQQIYPVGLNQTTSVEEAIHGGRSACAEIVAGRRPLPPSAPPQKSQSPPRCSDGGGGAACRVLPLGGTGVRGAPQRPGGPCASDYPTAVRRWGGHLYLFRVGWAAREGGLEPPTCGFGIRCYRLSYTT